MHERRLAQCKVCTPGYCRKPPKKCPHELQRSQCKVCTPGFCRKKCPHELQRSMCKVCTPGYCPKKCPHERVFATCRECNDNIRNQPSNCNECGNQLYPKRTERNGGIGICSGCEEHAKQVAFESGSAPPPKGKRWEDVVLDELTKLVVTKEGRVEPHEMRDDFKHMLGSNKRRRTGECSTNHQRRPDLLYLVRDVNRRIIAFLIVEVDEDSHQSYSVDCEGGKIDETYDCLVTLAQKEGASEGSAVRHDAQLPHVMVFKFNPNACDGGTFTLAHRIAQLAKQCNEFLQMDHAKLKGFDNRTTHVRTLYYHSKRGGPILEYLKDAARKGAIQYGENECL